MKNRGLLLLLLAAAAVLCRIAWMCLFPVAEAPPLIVPARPRAGQLPPNTKRCADSGRPASLRSSLHTMMWTTLPAVRQDSVSVHSELCHSGYDSRDIVNNAALQKIAYDSNNMKEQNYLNTALGRQWVVLAAFYNAMITTAYSQPYEWADFVAQGIRTQARPVLRRRSTRCWTSATYGGIISSATP